MQEEERERLIDAIVEDVDSWDLENLIGYVQAAVERKLRQLNDDQLLEEYQLVYYEPWEE
jgi:hypothetical protein